MSDQNRVLVHIDPEQLRPDRTQFKAGNTAAAKPKWSHKRLQKFGEELRSFRTLIGFNYSEMGRALGVSGQYIKFIENAQRQPSARLVHLFRKLKATPSLSGERMSSEALTHLAELWKHILSRRFRCPGCAREVRKGQRHKGLDYWWGMPNQRYCPQHQRSSRKRKRK